MGLMVLVDVHEACAEMYLEMMREAQGGEKIEP